MRILRKENKIMTSTFDKFINDNPEQKALFEKEYNEFLLSEFVLEKMEEENLTVRALAKKASVSPTVIQKIRKNETSNKISFGTFLSVIDSLGYRMKLEKM